MKYSAVLFLVLCFALSAAPGDWQGSAAENPASDKKAEEKRKIMLSDFTGYPKCGASSRLQESKDWRRHHELNLFDRNRETAWAEGSEGDGVGEEVWFEIEPWANELKIINGYARTEKLFNSNNRVKKIELSLWAGIHKQGMVSEIGRLFESRRITPVRTAALSDTREVQKVPLNIDWKSAVKRFSETVDAADAFEKAAYILVLRIAEIYKGARYNDTCMSQISWTLYSEHAGPGGLGRIELAGIWINEQGGRWGRLNIDWNPYLQSWSSFVKDELYDSGTWRIGRGKLILTSDGKEAEFVYIHGSLDKTRLTLKTDKGKIEIWNRR